MQITKAMELVASSKMRHAKERALGARPYFNALYQTITRLAGATRGSESIYTKPREVKNSLYTVSYTHLILKRKYISQAQKSNDESRCFFLLPAAGLVRKNNGKCCAFFPL